MALAVIGAIIIAGWAASAINIGQDNEGRQLVRDLGFRAALRPDPALLAAVHGLARATATPLQIPLRVAGYEESYPSAAAGPAASSVHGAVSLPPPTPYPDPAATRRATWAAAIYGVEWAVPDLVWVEYCESGGRTDIVGLRGELGPMQFLPSTWASLPPELAAGDPTDPYDAMLAAAWMVSAGRWGEWACWPR